MSDTESSGFGFKYVKNQKYFFGGCEWCNNKNILRVICKCKTVRYCNQECLEKDKRFHEDKCSANKDSELSSVNVVRS